jgi:hypothetical protein
MVGRSREMVVAPSRVDIDARLVLPGHGIRCRKHPIVTFYETRPGITASGSFAVIDLLGLRLWLLPQWQA